MEENNEKPDVPQSPKPMAFTVDFGEGNFDAQRQKNMLEKFQKKHRRGQSLSKIEAPKKHPLTGNLPRKSSFQSEGYFSSDEKSDRSKNVRVVKRSDLTLPLKSVNSMTQSYPDSATLFSINTPEIELKDVSSPELDAVSPFSPNRVELPKASSPEFEDRSDTVSDAGTYTLEADNYSEEQKARMSIDAEFKIEQVSVLKKTEEYIKSLSNYKQMSDDDKPLSPKALRLTRSITPTRKLLSPILSPTQNFSITQDEDKMNNESINKTFTKIMFPSPKTKNGGLEIPGDRGCVISITSSGAFRKEDPEKSRRLSLTKSEIQVEAYVGNKIETNEIARKKLTANIVNVQSIQHEEKVTNLPPMGKLSPSKIPSPIHTISRPRSRNNVNVDLSDSSLETESYLKPTQNCINSLQQRLSLDSDHESDYDNRYGLNNHNLLKQKHIRHNSLDDKISNKLEHFQTKNLQAIDQTYVFNQYKVMQKIQNSPNNSPIRRSCSFSKTKNTNLERNSPSFARNSAIQRSASTANIKPTFVRRGSVDHQKIDRNQFGDTESSSEEDFEKNLAKKKDLSNLTNTRYNRAFSLRRARLDDPVVKCPNTPEMRRKFQPDHGRAISVDRKPVKTNEVQSRYMMNVSKRNIIAKPEVKNVPKPPTKSTPSKPQVFSRTDSGRFSTRSNKPTAIAPQKAPKKDAGGKKSSGRSNSSLSSREKDFQNWKRRKSYDPMKAAAEGKRKELVKKQNIMTQSYTEANQDCDSSPSRSSSVHRSQSFHGTAALEQLISSEEEEDLTLSADEGFTPPTPSPCELSPARASLRNAWKDHVLH